jgi:hypothetical protein
MQIAESARKHGVGDNDMLHALRLAIRRIALDEGFVLYIGSARSGEPLEIGVIADDTDSPTVIHAMKLRPSFYRYL